MEWYNYVAIFFSGAFLANVIPHFFHGISGDKFPTPFAKPPGQGLSSPLTNVLWGGLNMVVGFILFKAGKIETDNNLHWLVFFAGIMAISIMLSIRFSTKHKE
jgi:hypothetical protein